jgi:hypothetical protein
MNNELQGVIHRSAVIAYEAGRRAERQHFWKAIDLNHTSNDIGEYIYLNDLKDALKELDEAENNKVA